MFMGFKKSIGLSIASALLGIALLGGGTYAAFTTETESNNSLKAGVIDLTLGDEVLFNLSQFKPGDTVEKSFHLRNDGNMVIGDIELITDYEVIDLNNDNGNIDLGDYIEVEYIINDGTSIIQSQNKIVERKTLSYLKDNVITGLSRHVPRGQDEYQYELRPGTRHYVRAKIKFVDTNRIDQNIFQGDEIKFRWTFNGKQEEGTER